MTKISSNADHLAVLSQLVLTSPDGARLSRRGAAATSRPDSKQLIWFPEENLGELQALANSHHVVIRAFDAFCGIPEAAQRPGVLEWASRILEKERARIGHALSFLQRICATLDAHGCPVIVIKSLDHWPDLGSDLDLFTTAKSADVLRIMAREFDAALAPRSWGDRLANKWNFSIPGLPELVEVHVGRLGQTGEQVAVAQNLASRAREIQVGSRAFRLPAPEDRIIISTLQRMYRHFYLRLCDVVDTARLLEGGQLDYAALQHTAEEAGLWKGVAAYLVVVSDYVQEYRGYGVSLPEAVVGAARFGGDEVRFERGFLRIPIAPHAMGFYASELTTLALNRELRSTLRLSLLPCLATAAAIEQRITGSDKGIW